MKLELGNKKGEKKVHITSRAMTLLILVGKDLMALFRNGSDIWGRLQLRITTGA